MRVSVKKLLDRIRSDESGQDLVEYTLLLVLLALAAVAAMEFLGGAVGNGMNNATSQIDNAGAEG